MRAALRSPQLRVAQLGWGASIMAEWMHFVALGVFAYDAGGAVAVGVVGACGCSRRLCWRRSRRCSATATARERLPRRMAGTAALALAASAAAATMDNAEFAVYALAAHRRPRHHARAAGPAGPPPLARAHARGARRRNGATSTFESLGTLVGPLVAGGVVAAAGTAWAFTLAAGVLRRSRRSCTRACAWRGGSSSEAGTTIDRSEVLAGLDVVLRSPQPRLVVGLMVAQSFVRGALNVLIVVAAFEVLDAGAGAVGYMTAAIGVGGLFGALGAFGLAGRRLALPFGLALIVWGTPIALLAPMPYVAVAVVLLAFVGAANSVEDVAGFTLLQRIVPDRILTRVLGAVWGLAMGGMALGSLVTPALVELVGARATLLVIGAVLPALILFTWSRLRELDRSTTEPEGLGIVSGVPMFAPLPLAAKEHVASRLQPVSVAAGDVVIRAGDVGDRFYVVTGGELTADAGGDPVVLGEGDSFGEIALLRDVPRTATVRATTDATLAALERADFLEAVGAHREARAAGEDVATARLARSPS